MVFVVFVGILAVLILLFGIFHPGGDDDLHRHLFVDGSYIVVAAAVGKCSHHGVLLALHHADDPSLGFAVMPEPAHLHQHLVAVHGVADLGRRNKDVAL